MNVYQEREIKDLLFDIFYRKPNEEASRELLNKLVGIQLQPGDRVYSR